MDYDKIMVEDVAAHLLYGVAALEGIAAVPYYSSHPKTKKHWRREARRVLAGLVAALIWPGGIEPTKLRFRGLAKHLRGLNRTVCFKLTTRTRQEISGDKLATTILGVPLEIDDRLDHYTLVLYREGLKPHYFEVG